MATPTNKAASIDKLFSDLFGVNRASSIAADTCTMCGEKATEFKDELSRKEFAISGMCQKCQDMVFSDPYPDE